MSDHILNRKTFSTSRLLEFFTAKELQMQIGHSMEWWPDALLKELIDNSLDACEAAGILPHIQVVVGHDFISVEDNGPGLPEETLKRSLDYAVRISDKSHYVSPTRGQLGNALKCVWAAPFVAGGGEYGRVDLTVNGREHQIEITLDRIEQKPVLKHMVRDSTVKNGTFVKIHWPEIASLLPQKSTKSADFYRALELLAHFAAFNQHARFTFIVGDVVRDFLPTKEDWGKWLPTNPTSPHWYSVERLQTLIAAIVSNERNGGPAITVRDFISEFKGLTATKRRMAAVAAAGLSGMSLADLVRDGNIDQAAVNNLLSAMQDACTPVKPQSLGIIGKGHLSSWLVKNVDAIPASVQYKVTKGLTKTGLPFVLEMALGICATDVEGRSVIAGVNFTPLLDVPFLSLSYLLGECRVDEWDPIVLVVHLACPQVEFTDRGKSRASLPDEISKALAIGIRSVTKKWKEAKRRADQNDRVHQRQLDELRKAEKRTRVTVKDAAYQVMGAAYMKASANNTLPANARQIMYAARPLVIELTGKARPWSHSSYFTQALLPNFVEEHPELTSQWDVLYDARGRLMEPHTSRRVDLGTLAVRDYINQWHGHINASVEGLSINTGVDTLGPVNRYGFALFVEKEGFNELLKAVRFAERYDLAIMSTKGMSVTAARRLVEKLSIKSVAVLVLHDFDKAGFSIVHTLRTDTRRYRYSVSPKVIDLGLRLGDIQTMDLEKEEVTYDSKVSPRGNLRESGASAGECDFLVRGGYSKAWHGHRVELNAMTSDQFVSWLKEKLEQAGVRKVVPDAITLERAYKRDICIARVQKVVDQVVAKQGEMNVEIPSGLLSRIGAMIQGTDKSWDQAVWELAKEEESLPAPSAV